MIVGIDGRSLASPVARRGVGHYTNSLIGELAAGHPGDAWRVLTLGGDAPPLPPGAVAVVRRAPRRAAFAAGALVGRPRLDRLLGAAPDVVWMPAPAPAGLSRGARLVLTVHDLTFITRPQDYTPYERAWHAAGRLRRLARRAARVMAVSATVREELLERWGLEPERVRVVAPGVSRPAGSPDPELPARLGLPDRYLLFIGALEPRKAPDLLARAFERARAGGLDAALAVVGTGRMTGVFGLPGVHRIEPVRDRAALEALYAGALALVMPSRAEGYGSPPLEAAACGTPAVVSDLPIFRETLGEAALRVAPGDEAALADALLRIAGDAGLRDRLAREAALAIEDRTWHAAAQAAHQVFTETVA